MLSILLSLVWCVLSISVFTLLKRRYAALPPLLETTEVDPELPTLAVIIPARNEADNIGECLESLVRQRYPSDRLQIIVVNDGSSDDTERIARQFPTGPIPIEVIEAGTLPDDWLGKSHACWVGARAASAEWLCFLDADTRHSPRLLCSVIEKARTDGIDLLSLHPQQEMLGFWERLLMPIPFMTLMILLDGHAINNPESDKAMANGQFILIRAEVYERLEGHAAIRDEVLEDVAIARLVKSAGYVLKVFAGEGLIRTRMYKGLVELWQGVARGGSELFGIPLTMIAVVSSLVGALFPIILPAWRIAEAAIEPNTALVASAVLAVLGSVAWYGAHALALRKYHVPVFYLVLIPLSSVLIAVVNTDGIIRRLFGRRIWKGRPV